MFTLGNKEAVINTSSQFPVTVTAPTGTNSLLTIKGFGAFEDTHILSAVAQRFIPGRNAGLIISAPDAAALGVSAAEVNVPVKIHIRVNTSRHTSEWATDFIKRGRPFIFEIVINGGDTSTSIMTNLVNMFTEYEAKFNHSMDGLPFTWTQTGADVVLMLKSPYLTFQNVVDFLPKGKMYGTKAETTRQLPITVISSGSVSTTQVVTSTADLVVGDTIFINTTEVVITDITSATNIEVTPACVSSTSDTVYLLSQPQEPTFDGKYLEENVRMSTTNTMDSYGISPDEVPTINGAYTSLTFEVIDNNTGGINNLAKRHSFLGITRGEVGGDRHFMFTIYFLESTDMFNTGEKVDDVLAFLLAAAPTNTTMKLSNGNTVTTVADFLTNTY